MLSDAPDEANGIVERLLLDIRVLLRGLNRVLERHSRRTT